MTIGAGWKQIQTHIPFQIKSHHLVGQVVFFLERQIQNKAMERTSMPQHEQELVTYCIFPLHHDHTYSYASLQAKATILLEYAQKITLHHIWHREPFNLFVIP